MTRPLPAELPGAMPSFEVPRPYSLAAWQHRAEQVRPALWRLLGDLPPRSTPTPIRMTTRAAEGYLLEEIAWDNGAGDEVHGYVLLPDGPTRRRPAVLYHHYHGDRYEQGKEELLQPSLAEFGNPGLVPGVDLVRRGYVVLAIDAYGFGARRFSGPGGKTDDGRQTEASLAKMFLWQGRTLWGMIVRDDLMAFDYLQGRTEVDPGRVAAVGMSMGATRSWWAAALEPRIAAVVSASCLTRYQNLLADGALREHGIYYFVPGVLREQIDTELIVSLIAPRPHLTLTGDSDAGSPVDGVQTINEFAQHVYRICGQAENFRGLVYEGVGHQYTPAMWQQTLDWLDRFLGES